MGADGGLEEWAAGSDRRRPGGWPRGYLLFAFYGRVSIEDWQDPASSLARQREQAGALVSEPDLSTPSRSGPPAALTPETAGQPRRMNAATCWPGC
jgi:hypothetical protein